MRVSRAKRRFNRWARYVASTGSQSASKWTAGNHWGLAKAHMDVMTARRAAPHGLRSPWWVAR
jgi:hypothetical protein